MSQVNSDQVLFFFGAGASAPFGIPTMKQFVIDFEKHLEENASEEERKAYAKIKRTLEKRLNKPVDLEGIFTVIDGIINYHPDKLGLLSVYLTAKIDTPNADVVSTCVNLKEKFQRFVREKCAISKDRLAQIRNVYRDLFNRFSMEFGFSQQRHKGDCYWNPSWVIFTTNYDLCLEYYLREVAESGISTGFTHQPSRNVNILSPHSFLNEGFLQLLKLHGSINWLIDKKTNNVIEVAETGRSYLGREYEGEMMIYPIAEKELYLDPYISMLLRLNRELERKSVWLVIGYSFNDPVVREIFIRKSTSEKRLILVHPQANSVSNHRLSGMKAEQILMEKHFGVLEEIVDITERKITKRENFRKVNHQIIHKLKEKPSYGWEKTP